MCEERSELSSQGLTDINIVGRGELYVQATSNPFPVSYLNNEKGYFRQHFKPKCF